MNDRKNVEECDRAANVHRHEMMRVRAEMEADGAVQLCSDCDEPAAPRSCYCRKCEAAIYGDSE